MYLTDGTLKNTDEDVTINKGLDVLNIICTVNTKYGDVYVKI